MDTWNCFGSVLLVLGPCDHHLFLGTRINRPLSAITPTEVQDLACGRHVLDLEVIAERALYRCYPKFCT